MREDRQRPQINLAKIPVSGNLAGIFFAVVSMAIFFIGIPALWYIFPAAIVLGGGVALILHFIRHDSPGASWIPAPKK